MYSTILSMRPHRLRPILTILIAALLFTVSPNESHADSPQFPSRNFEMQRNFRNLHWFACFFGPQSWLEKSENERIRDAMIWNNRSYDQWLYWQKNALRNAFARACMGRATTLSNPPINIAPNVDEDEAFPTTYISMSDAEDLYVEYLGEILVTEIKNKVPWSLLDLRNSELRIILNSTSYFTKIDPSTAKIQGYSLPAPPDIVWDFIQENNLIGSTRKETIVRLIRWSRNLSHFLGRYRNGNMEDHWHYRGMPPAAHVIEGTTHAGNDRFGHYTGGCWGTTWFYITVLRVLNIPVEGITLEGTRVLPNGDTVIQRHAAPWFKSEDLFLSHGDDPYNQVSKLIDEEDVSEILLELWDFFLRFGYYVTSEQRLENVGSKPCEVVIETIPWKVMEGRCQDTTEGTFEFTNWLNNSCIDNTGNPQIFWQDVETKISQEGGCTSM